MDRRILAANRTIRIRPDFEFTKPHLQRIETDQPSDQRISKTEKQLCRFDSLENSDNAGQHTENASFSAARYHAGRRWLWEHAAVTGTTQVRRKHGRLTIESEDGAVDVRFFGQHTDVVRQVTSRKVIRTVDDNVVVLD